MEIDYKAQLPDEDSFFELFATTGWNDEVAKSREELFWSITNSWYVVTAYRGDVLVGFGRIISDGYLHAIIADMIIAPEYKNQGIGKEILKLLVQEAQKQEVTYIRLFATAENRPFYLKNGFGDCSDGLLGMEYKL